MTAFQSGMLNAETVQSVQLFRRLNMSEVLFNEALLSPATMETIQMLIVCAVFGGFSLLTIWMLPWSQDEVDTVYHTVLQLLPSRTTAQVSLPSAPTLGK